MYDVQTILHVCTSIFQVYLKPVKSHIQTRCDGKLSQHLKTFGFDGKGTSLKRIFQRLLKIYTIKTIFWEDYLKASPGDKKCLQVLWTFVSKLKRPLSR